MQVNAFQWDSIWPDPRNPLPVEEMARIRAFLASYADGDIVAWRMTALFSLFMPVGVVCERVFVTGTEGSVRAVRHGNLPESGDYIDSRFPSIMHCKVPGQGPRFVMIDCWGAEQGALVLCRDGDDTDVRSAIDGFRRTDSDQRGRIWQYGYPADATPWKNLDEKSYEWSEGLESLVIDNTVTFLRSKEADDLRDWGVAARRGVLLHGRPGNGKTVLVNLAVKAAIAAGVNVLYIDLDEMWDDKGIGRQLQMATADLAPVVIIFEDIDIHIATGKETGLKGKDSKRIQTDLVQFLDGSSARGPFAFLATANAIDALEPRLLRPGRLDIQQLVAGPSEAQALAVLKRQLKMGRDETFQLPEIDGPIMDLSLDKAGKDSYSFADIVEIANLYKLNIIREEKKPTWSSKVFKATVERFVDARHPKQGPAR